MGSLKDALLKAGLKPTTSPKEPNNRDNIPKKKITESIAHQVQRNFCEECTQVQPDVEFYQHQNPTTEALWICVRCADRLKIQDKFRRTAQSDTSIKKLFRREYGPTLSNAELNIQAALKPKGPANGNR
jgi:hypothetical protein